MVEMDNEILDILLVAEDEGLAEMYKLKLELDGYRVRVVSRHETYRICEPVPSLVFLDIKRVDRENLRFLSDLRSNSLTQDVPVVVLTEYREEELRERGVRLGARDYLVRVPSPQAAAQRLRPGNLVTEANSGRTDRTANQLGATDEPTIAVEGRNEAQTRDELGQSKLGFPAADSMSLKEEKNVRHDHAGTCQERPDGNS